METMTSRERWLATAAFEKPDRPFRCETLGFWPETLERWHSEGLPAEINEDVSAYIYSGFDLQLPALLGADKHPGFDPVFEEEVLERNDRYVIKRDLSGSVVKVLADGSSTIPGWIEAPVRDRASWEEVRQRLDPASPGRYETVFPLLDVPGAEDWPLCLYVSGLFGTQRHLLGFTPLMVAYRRQPELLHDIARQWVTLWKGVAAGVSERRTPELVSFWEDMCYLNGPMIGPRAFDEFMAPYYGELVGFLREELGVPTVGVDTDGDCTLLIPKFVQAGVNVIWPFEVQAGMDVVRLRRQFGRDLRMTGGIDKRALAQDPAAIRRAVDAVMPLVADGGYVPSLDHSAPPDIPWANMCYYMEYLRERLEKG